MAQHNLDLVSLDFDEYKNSLKSFLRSQELFKDYDFDGSDLNVLIDLLTVNTHKNAFFNIYVICNLYSLLSSWKAAPWAGSPEALISHSSSVRASLAYYLT